LTEDNLKNKTISALSWSFTDSFVNQGFQFIVGIILARLLTPTEFGLIGIITVFLAISNVFIDSGISDALIRKKNTDKADLSTAFYFNVGVAILLFLILFFSAPFISNFFSEPDLTSLVRVLSLNLILTSFAAIHRTILIKNLNFKLQTKISLSAAFVAGIAAIGFAYYGFGVWSLVIRSLLYSLITTTLFWVWHKWYPAISFSIRAFKEMFGFGYKLFFSRIIDTIYMNIYNLVIGKFFSAADLGFYTRADQLKNLIVINLTITTQKVTYPVLSQIQDDNVRLKRAYKRIIKTTMFVTFYLMIILAVVADPLIITLIGNKWLPSVQYLQLLCAVGILFPLHAINLNMLNVKGRSDLFLKLEIIKKFLAVPAIIIGIFYGIKIMIIGIILNSVFAYFLNSYYSGRMLGYPVKEQIIDLVPSFLVILTVGIITFFIGKVIILTSFLMLIIQISISVISLILLSELLKFEEYIEIKKILTDKLKPLFNKK